MSKTYGFLLYYLPRPVAISVLVLWYIVLMLLVIEKGGLPLEDIVYLDD